MDRDLSDKNQVTTIEENTDTPFVDTQPLINSQQIDDSVSDGAWNECTQQLPNISEYPPEYFSTGAECSSSLVGNYSPSSPDWHSQSAQLSFREDGPQVNSPQLEDYRDIPEGLEGFSPETRDRYAHRLINRPGPLDQAEIIFLRRYAQSLVDRGDLF